MINFNNGGVCPSPSIVQDSLARSLALSNEAPAYKMWQLVEPRKELVRTQLARHFGCDREEIAIVRNASWIDPAADGGPRIAVLLSNRVHLGRDDARIRDARQAFHAAAARLR